MDIEEKAIIKEAQRGNLMAFETLVKRYDRQVLQLTRSIVHHVEDAEDIYQEVFVRVFRNLRKFHFRSEFSTWLYRVVVNHCLNFKKRSGRKRTFSLENESSSGENWQTTIKGTGKNPEQSMLNTELGDQIDQAIDQLSDRQRVVFELRHYHGHKLKEIAEIMGCSEGTVKNYLFRATQKLQQLLIEY